MANESAKRLMAKNAATLQKYVYVILGVNVRTSRCRSYLLPRLHVHSPSATHTAWMPCRRSTPHAYALQALYVLFRVYYLWDSFSRWHMGAYAAILLAYLALYSFLKLSATPKYAPLAQGGGLVSAGSDLEQKGLIECVFPILPICRSPCFPIYHPHLFQGGPTREHKSSESPTPKSTPCTPQVHPTLSSDSQMHMPLSFSTFLQIHVGSTLRDHLLAAEHRIPLRLVLALLARAAYDRRLLSLDDDHLPVDQQTGPRAHAWRAAAKGRETLKESTVRPPRVGAHRRHVCLRRWWQPAVVFLLQVQTETPD